MYVPKVDEQVELHLLIKDQAQVIQAMQVDFADEMAKIKVAYTNEIAEMKATYAEEMAKMKATIQANLEAHNEERRLQPGQGGQGRPPTQQSDQGLIDTSKSRDTSCVHYIC